MVTGRTAVKPALKQRRKQNEEEEAVTGNGERWGKRYA